MIVRRSAADQFAPRFVDRITCIVRARARVVAPRDVDGRAVPRVDGDREVRAEPLLAAWS